MTNINLFETKEQYFNFISAWKKSTKSVNATTRKERKVTTYRGSQYETWNITPSWLQAEQHIIYNLARGRDPKLGFSPIVNPNKIRGNDPMYAYNKAVRTIKLMHHVWDLVNKAAEPLTEDVWTSNNRIAISRGRTYAQYLDQLNSSAMANKEQVTTWLAPFEGTIIQDDLKKIVAGLENANG